MEIREKPEFSATELARLLEQFFADYPRAALLEDGRVLFEMPHVPLLDLDRAWPLRPASVVRRAEHGPHGGGSGSAQRDTAHPGAPSGGPAAAIAASRKGPRPADAGNPHAQQDQISASAGAAAHPPLQRIQSGEPALGHGPGAQLWSGVCTRLAGAWATMLGAHRGQRRGEPGGDRWCAHPGHPLARLLPRAWRRQESLPGTQGSVACRMWQYHAGAHGLAESRSRAMGAL